MQTAKGRDSILVADPSLVGDELELFQRMRYISASEAFMKFFDVKLHMASPGVTPYTVHLPGEDRVNVPDNDGSGSDDAAVNPADVAAGQLSWLLRYFCRPKRLVRLKMLEYYEQYNVKSPLVRKAGAVSDDDDVEVSEDSSDGGSDRGGGRHNGGRARGRAAVGARGGARGGGGGAGGELTEDDCGSDEYDDFGRTSILQDDPTHLQSSALPYNVSKRKREHVARFYHVSPMDAERYYLRLLLENVAATSFDDLYTVDGTRHPSFYAACKARLLVTSGEEHEQSMRVCIQQLGTPGELRRHFAKLIMFNGANVDRRGLFWKFVADMAHGMHVPGQPESARFVLATLQGMDERTVGRDGVHAAAAWSVLDALEAIAARDDKSLSNYGLPTPDEFYDGLPGAIRRTFTSCDRAPVVEAALSRQCAERHRAAYEECLRLATEEQKAVIVEAVQRLEHNVGGIMFIDAKAGRGKTWVMRAVAHYLWSRGKVNIACAFSGLASLNHDEGVTAHRAFALPLDVSFNEDCPSMLDRNTDRGRLLAAAACVMVDEICSLHGQYFKMIVDACRAFQVEGHQKLFIVAGDFRQTLPVVKSESSAAVVAACVKASPYWSSVDTYQLHQPQRDARDSVYSQWVDGIGDGTAPGPVAVAERGNAHLVTLPRVPGCPDRSVRLFTDPSEFRSAVYGDLRRTSPGEVARRMIISPTNITAAEHNLAYHEGLPGEEVCLPAAHTCNVGHDLDPAFASNEYMASVRDTSGNAPDADLRLKIGSVVFVCRNLDPEQRIMNGTKAEVLAIDKYCLKLRTFASAAYPATTFTLCRLQFEVKTGAYSFFRTQFPVRLAAASTIHKTQGQNLACVGLDARTHCFTHGQLYAALTRVSGMSDLCVLLPPSTDLTADVHVLNVVFKSVLQGFIVAPPPLPAPPSSALPGDEAASVDLADDGSDSSNVVAGVHRAARGASAGTPAARPRRGSSFSACSAASFSSAVSAAGGAAAVAPARVGGVHRAARGAPAGAAAARQRRGPSSSASSGSSSSTASSAAGGAAAVTRARFGRSRRHGLASNVVSWAPSRREREEAQVSRFFVPVIHAVLHYRGDHITALRLEYDGFDELVSAYRADFAQRGFNRGTISMYGPNKYVPPAVQERLLCPVGFNDNGGSHVPRRLWDAFEQWINVQRLVGGQ